ncbi:hypothetical protein [Natronocalculus amylovorans]|nr:hypothetical protein [Natronocalculus amylovorans]
MSKWLTDEELDRLSRFANMPAHARTPEMLLPEDDPDDNPEP